MRYRFLGALVAVAALAVTVFGVPLSFAATRLYRSRDASRLDRAAEAAAATVTSAALRAGLVGADTARSDGHRVTVGLYDRHRQRVAGRGPAVGTSEVVAALDGHVQDQHVGSFLVVAVPIYEDGRIIGASRAALPWDVVTEDAREASLAMLALALLVVSLAGTMGWWLSSRLARPIESLTGFAVRLGDGDFAARVAPAGVPEVDEAGEALNRTASRLGELVGRERAFSADVSHQLNTPLTSLRLALESAEATPGADTHLAIQTALAEVDRLQTTVDTLLRFSRDATPAGPPADPAAVGEALAERVRHQLSVMDRAVVVELDPGAPCVRCSPEVLTEILSVLLDNAIRHGEGTVTLLLRRVGSGAIIEVGDEGAGVEHPGQLFERRSADATGHGIGLALARSLAEAHGARLELTRAGPHPRFTVALEGADPTEL